MHIQLSLLAVALAPLVQALVAGPACCTDTVPASTHTITVTATGTTTETVTGTPSTSNIFLPGNPPASSAPAKKRLASPEVDEQAVNGILPRGECNADNCLRALRRHTGAPFCATYTQTTNTATTGLPTYIPTQCNPSRISSACSCLSTAETAAPYTTPTSTSRTSTSTTITTTTSCDCPPVSIPASYTTITVAVATTTVSPAPETRTIYPCADPLPSPGPAYGDYAATSDLGLSNSLYNLGSPEAASAQACCNTCFFEIPNCVQAYFYFYEGCVVSQATDLASANGTDVSSVCPAGLFEGLTYGPDVSPAFRSTGNIAGPCGVAYDNF